MKVGELIAALQHYNTDDLVVIAKDGEGNGFSPLTGSLEEVYVAENAWSGETHSREEEWDDAVPCVTLWPKN